MHQLTFRLELKAGKDHGTQGFVEALDCALNARAMYMQTLNHTCEVDTYVGDPALDEADIDGGLLVYTVIATAESPAALTQLLSSLNAAVQRQSHPRDDVIKQSGVVKPILTPLAVAS